MKRPYEVDTDYLGHHVDEMVDSVFSDLQSQFLVLPKGRTFVDYARFETAYEVIKRHTVAFSDLSIDRVMAALREESLCLVVLRTIVGLTPPEWADLARAERASDISQGYARSLEGRCRSNPNQFATLRVGQRKAFERVAALVSIAVDYINRGAGAQMAGTLHRLDKVDTAQGLASLQYISAQHVPYAMLLCERYLGRPFASHRDSVSELVGDVMENAIEERLSTARVSFRKTKRAERIPGFSQAPDFFVPDEFNPVVVVEAKITGDDGTARDKIARIQSLADIRDQRTRDGLPSFELIACVDGRGFGVRREDIKKLLLNTAGKVFTLSTVDQLIANTHIRDFLPESTNP